MNPRESPGLKGSVAGHLVFYRLVPGGDKMLLVLPTVDQMTDILDLKPIYWFSLLWLWVTLAVLFLLLAAFLVRLYLKRRKKEVKPVEIIIPEKIITPKEKALSALENLEELGLLERGQYRKYYFVFSEIVKTFLEEELKILAIDSTTEEIALLLSTSRLTADQQTFIENLLKEMDLVKFARKVPSNAQVVELRQSVYKFLNSF